METLKNLFEEKKSPSESLDDAIDNWEINQRSRLYLENKIIDFSSDWITEDYEEDFLNKQIEYHKSFNEVIKEYNSIKDDISNKSREEIENYILENNSRSIWNSHIDFLEQKIINASEILSKSYFWNSIRNNVEANIDIDWVVESVRSNKKIENFFKIFSLYYLNIIENKTSSKSELINIMNNPWLGLMLTREETFNLTKKIVVENYDFFKNFDYSFGIKIFSSDSELNIDLQNIINQIERENSLSYKKDLLIEIIRWEEWSTQRVNEILWTNINNYELLLENYTKYLIDQSIINKSELLNVFEQNNNNFNYLDFLNNYWFTENLDFTYREMIQRQLLWTRIWWENITLDQEYINENYNAIINNLEVFTKIILEVESSGRNVANNSWSSARWYFQYMTWNNGNSSRSDGKFTSIETALRRYYMEYSWNTNIPNNKLEHHNNVPSWVVDFYNRWNLDTRDLTAEQQNELFIIDLFKNNRRIENWAWGKVGINDFLWLIAIGNSWAIKKAYGIFHHTNTDNQTEQVLTRVLNKYSSELVTLE